MELVEDKGEEEVTWFEFGFDEERLSTPNGWNPLEDYGQHKRILLMQRLLPKL